MRSARLLPSQVDEAAALASIKKAVSEVATPAALGRGGRLIKTTGDGALFEFTSAVEAVAAALAVQNGLQHAGSGGPAFRIGIISEMSLSRMVTSMATL